MTTTTASKPALQSQLRAVWRRSREHYLEQAKRFSRLFTATLVPQLFALDFNHVTRSAVIALIVPAVEVTFRQWYPALGAAGADSAPGVTIVPSQVSDTPPVPDDQPLLPDDAAAPAPIGDAAP